MKQFRTSQSEQGFVILFAVLISAIILLIGVGIFQITVKETILSSAARESTVAFFAADGGLECALYEANVRRGFSASGTPASMPCNGEDVPYLMNESLKTSFFVELPTGCSQIEVDRLFYPSGASVAHTKIISHGYNVCDGDRPDIGDPILLERVLELTYPNAQS